MWRLLDFFSFIINMCSKSWDIYIKKAENEIYINHKSILYWPNQRNRGRLKVTKTSSPAHECVNSKLETWILCLCRNISQMYKEIPRNIAKIVHYSDGKSAWICILSTSIFYLIFIWFLVCLPFKYLNLTWENNFMKITYHLCKRMNEIFMDN